MCIRLFIVTCFLFFVESALANTLADKLVQAALDRTSYDVVYDGRYVSISYPGGDVPKNIGVCTDVVIRSYRELGIDLQQLVHEDIRDHFDAYPSARIWGLKKPDSNIDHRRVPNLQVFFERHGQKLALSDKAEDYLPGDLVTWYVGGNLPHIGIVTDHIDEVSGHPKIVHNIGSGPKLDDMLFSYPITGHYRFFPE